MKNPLISISTVCLNSEKTIQHTIESVLNQTYTNLEYIIVDGNSSDNTVSIINSYKDAFHDKGIGFKSISEPDRGIYDAMNKAISLSTGELVGVIGSDDWYELNALEIVADRYKQTGADYIHGDIKVYNSKRTFLKLRKAGTEKQMIKEMSFFHPASFIKRKILEDLNGYSLDYRICADYDLILRIINKDYSVNYLKKIIANVCYGGISTAQVNEALSESHLIRKKNGYNPNLSRFYYYRALLVYRLKTFLSLK